MLADNSATMAIIATQNCPDCCGKGTVHMLRIELPCPACRTDEYRSTMEALGLADELPPGFASL